MRKGDDKTTPPLPEPPSLSEARTDAVWLRYLAGRVLAQQRGTGQKAETTGPNASENKADVGAIQQELEAAQQALEAAKKTQEDIYENINEINARLSAAMEEELEEEKHPPAEDEILTIIKDKLSGPLLCDLIGENDHECILKFWTYRNTDKTNYEPSLLDLFDGAPQVTVNRRYRPCMGINPEDSYIHEYRVTAQCTKSNLIEHLKLNQGPVQLPAPDRSGHMYRC